MALCSYFPFMSTRLCTEVYIFNRLTMINYYDSIVYQALKVIWQNTKISKNFKKGKFIHKSTDIQKIV